MVCSRPKRRRQFTRMWLGLAIVAGASERFAHAQAVVPIDWNRFSTPTLTPFQTDIKQFINRSAGYNVNRIEQTMPTVATPQTPSGRRYDLQTGSENEVRSLSHIVYSAAAIMKSGAYNAGLTGFDETTFRNRTIEMIHGAAQEHISNGTGVLWGNEWQSALWAAHLAEGAWLMWDQLPAATRTLVTNMTVYEANRFVNYNVPYWANPNGSLNTPGDTKAEENAWNSRMLSVAVAMMPSHANSLTWRTKGSELMVSSFARPSDLTNPTSIDGNTVGTWLHGYNAYETGFVENHGFIHDDYMATTGLTVEPYITQTLAGQTVPQAAGFNADVVYNAMATMPVGPLNTTMFQRGPQGSYVPDPYYPEGTDWSYYRYDIFLEMDAYANQLGHDSGKPYDAMGWGQARLNRILQMQNRFTDGHLYAPGEFDTWATREPYALQTVTNIWMAEWLGGQNVISPQGNWLTSLTPPNVSHLRLRVDRSTGEAVLVNTSEAVTVTFDGYAVASTGGQLSLASWTKLAAQGLGNWIATNPSANLLGELRSSGGLAVAPGGQLSLGPIFSPAAPTSFGQTPFADLRFEVSGPGGQTFDSLVEYTGAYRNNTLTLVVDPATGRTLLRNDTPFSPAIEGYVITSAAGSLLPDNGFWLSLQDQGAAGWIEANPSASQVAELSGNGPFPLTAASVFNLGKLFNATHTHDLVFAFLLAGQATPMAGTVIYESIPIPGDFNRDGSVNAADYIVWREANGGTVAPGTSADANYDGHVNQQDYGLWRSHFGETAPSVGASSGGSVPEPSAAAAILLLWVAATLARSGRTHYSDSCCRSSEA